MPRSLFLAVPGLSAACAPPQAPLVTLSFSFLPPAAWVQVSGGSGGGGGGSSPRLKQHQGSQGGERMTDKAMAWGT